MSHSMFGNRRTQEANHLAHCAWFVILMLSSCPSGSLFAQGYPRLSKEQFATAKARMEAADKRSDEIFAAARPVLEEWSSKGKPYLPQQKSPSNYHKPRLLLFQELKVVANSALAVAVVA